MSNRASRKDVGAVRKQLLLTSEQCRHLKAIAATTRRSESELVREAVDGWLAKQAAADEDWKAAWRQAAGMWEGRDDLDEIMTRARRSWDRAPETDPRKTRKRR